MIYGHSCWSDHIQKIISLIPLLLPVSVPDTSLPNQSTALFLPWEVLNLKTLYQDEEASLHLRLPLKSVHCGVMDHPEQATQPLSNLADSEQTFTGKVKVIESLMNRSDIWGGNGLIAALGWLTWDLDLEKGGSMEQAFQAFPGLKPQNGNKIP